MVRIAKDCWNWKIEILHEGWKILLLLRFVPEISLPVCPNLHTPNNWHLSVYCYGGCGLVKAGDETLKTGKKHRVDGCRFLKRCCGSLRFLTLRTVPISELPHVRLPNCRAATAHAPWRSITSGSLNYDEHLRTSMYPIKWAKRFDFDRLAMMNIYVRVCIQWNEPKDLTSIALQWWTFTYEYVSNEMSQKIWLRSPCNDEHLRTTEYVSNKMSQKIWLRSPCNDEHLRTSMYPMKWAKIWLRSPCNDEHLRTSMYPIKWAKIWLRSPCNDEHLRTSMYPIKWAKRFDFDRLAMMNIYIRVCNQ